MNCVKGKCRCNDCQNVENTKFSEDGLFERDGTNEKHCPIISTYTAYSEQEDSVEENETRDESFIEYSKHEESFEVNEVRDQPYIRYSKHEESFDVNDVHDQSCKSIQSEEISLQPESSENGTSASNTDIIEV